jgi:hypothetical protein
MFNKLSSNDQDFFLSSVHSTNAEDRKEDVMKTIILTISIGLLLACHGASTPTGVQPVEVAPSGGSAVDLSGDWSGTLTVSRSDFTYATPCGKTLPADGASGSLHLTIRGAGPDRVSIGVESDVGPEPMALDGTVSGNSLSAQADPRRIASCGTAHTTLSASLSGNKLIGRIHTVIRSLGPSTQSGGGGAPIIDVTTIDESFNVRR